MEARYVCDRCKKEVTDFLKMQTTHVSTAGIGVRGSYLLCDKCADDFTDHFIDGYIAREPVELPAVYLDLGDGRLLKVPDSIVEASICIAAAEKAKGGDNDA